MSPYDVSRLQELRRRTVWHPWTPNGADAPIIVSGEGCVVTDIDGNRFLDAKGCVLNAAVGYGNRAVVEAIARQAATLMTYDLSGSSTVPAIELAARIADLAPGDLERTFFCSSGSEATEAAAKIALTFARLSGQPSRTRIAGLTQGYHGTTLTASHLTAAEMTRSQSGPAREEAFVSLSTPVVPGTVGRALTGAELTQAITRLRTEIDEAEPSSLAALFVEPVLGVGGAVVLPSSFVRELRTLTARHGILLVADEVMTGFGRTGRMFGVEHHNVVPDILLTSKSLAGGYAALAAVTTNQHVYSAFGRDHLLGGLRHGHTMSGHATACAAACAVLDIIIDKGLVDRSRIVGARLLDSLQADLDYSEHVVDVRGLGLIVAVEMRTVAAAEQVVANLRQCGVIVRMQDRVISLLPPLVIDDDEAALLAAEVADAVVALGRRPSTVTVSRSDPAGQPAASTATG